MQKDILICPMLEEYDYLSIGGIYIHLIILPFMCKDVHWNLVECSRASSSGYDRGMTITYALCCAIISLVSVMGRFIK